MATLSDKLDCDKEKLSRCLTLKLGVQQLSHVATKAQNKLKLRDHMATETLRPRYDTTSAMRGVMVRIEMANIEPPNKHASPHAFVSSVVELLGQPL